MSVSPSKSLKLRATLIKKLKLLRIKLLRIIYQMNKKKLLLKKLRRIKQLRITPLFRK
jgi:hypothetical protein